MIMGTYPVHFQLCADGQRIPGQLKVTEEGDGIKLWLSYPSGVTGLQEIITLIHLDENAADGLAFLLR